MVSMWETCCAPKLMISSQYIQQDGQELTTTLLHLGGGILKVFTVFIYIYQHISIYIYDLLMALGKIMGLQQLEMLNFKHVIFSTTVSIYTKDFLASWAFRRHGWAAAQKTQSSGLKVKDR